MKSYSIILAAGKGTRMRSNYPKVLHQVLGKPMLARVLKAVEGANIEQNYVVVGHGADLVKKALDDRSKIVLQEQQLGTGHAVLTALEVLKEDINDFEDATILVTCGDTPLIRSECLSEMLEKHVNEKNAVTVMTTVVDQPKGYGRIIRDNEAITAIVEEKDASAEQKKVSEINVGTYCFNMGFLVSQISKLNTNNAQGEFYLTDLLRIAYDSDLNTAAYILENAEESLGVNNRLQLAQAEKLLQKRINEQWMLAGVSMQDPSTIYIEDEVQLEQDVYLESNVHLFGKTHIEHDAVVEAGSRITDATIKQYAHIKQSIIKDAVVGAYTVVGPFAQLRPGTVLGEHIKVGNFVEVKNSNIANESKISHHTYIGDTDMGARVNVGCGTITCNYDGKNKYRTVIGDDVFVGSNTNLIAPIVIGDKTVIGAGSTLSKNVVNNALALTRPPLVIKENWRN